MTQAQLEHVNYSTPDPIKTAQLLVELFDWKIRLQGIALETGFSVHVAMKRNISRFTVPQNL